jgi:hypothetical protein
MDAESLRVQLERLGVRLSVHEGNLRCSAPKGTLTAELRQQLSDLKPELLRLLEPGRATQAPGERTLPEVSRDGVLPLSFTQERVWMLSRIAPEQRVTGNIPFAFRLIGDLNVEALEQSLSAVIQRHEVLRTGCRTENGRPILRIDAAPSFRLPVEDVSTLPADATRDVTRATAMRMAREPIDLSASPLLRARLVRTGAREHLFFLTTTVFAFDGWSSAILWREVSASYLEACAGRSAALPPLSSQYLDFAGWHRRWLSGGVLQEQRAFWKATLSGAALVTQLPIARSGVTQPGLESATVSFALPDFLASAVRALSRQAGVTLFITLLAAFQVLLRRYVNQDCITVGTIVSNRRLAETEAMIGPFSNNLLLRADFSSDQTFLSLLEQVRERAQSAYAHQELPLESLLGELDASLNRSPLFRVMFLLHQHESIVTPGLSLPGVTVEKLPVEKGRSNHMLNLVMADLEGVLSGTLEYSTALFDRASMEKLVEDFLVVLKKVSGHPMAALSTLPAFSDAARAAGHLEQALSGTPAPSRETGQVGTGGEPSVPVGGRGEEGVPEGIAGLVPALIGIWERLFGFTPIGPHDRFIALGGHSLLAVKLISEIEGRFGVELKLTSLEALPTIAELARQISRQGGEAQAE